MRKGIIFSVDAILGAGIVITLFSAIVVLSLSGPSAGAEQAMLYTKATDKTLTNFYSGGTKDTVPTAANVNCNEILKYGDNGNLDSNPEARGCSS